MPYLLNKNKVAPGRMINNWVQGLTPKAAGYKTQNCTIDLSHVQDSGRYKITVTPNIIVIKLKTPTTTWLLRPRGLIQPVDGDPEPPMSMRQDIKNLQGLNRNALPYLEENEKNHIAEVRSALGLEKVIICNP